MGAEQQIPFTQLNIINTEIIEAVGISIKTPALGTIVIISVHCSKGDCSEEEISTLIHRDNHFMICGHFNAHHESWSRQTNLKKAANKFTALFFNHLKPR
jgi:hypothetical protein